MILLTVVAGSVIGQLISLWVIGYFADRRQKRRAREIENAFQEALKEVEEKEKKMREYARMES